MIITFKNKVDEVIDKSWRVLLGIHDWALDGKDSRAGADRME
jgi:hypothetical protein